MTTPITVKSCAECPFFVSTLGSFLFGFITKPGEELLIGECDCPTSSGRRHYPMGARNTPEVAAARETKHKRLRILDGTVLPEKCPLRATDVVVTLGG